MSLWAIEMETDLFCLSVFQGFAPFIAFLTYPNIACLYLHVQRLLYDIALHFKSCQPGCVGVGVGHILYGNTCLLCFLLLFLVPGLSLYFDRMEFYSLVVRTGVLQHGTRTVGR